ncbi:hypothetical protein [Streptomyces sp. NPDC059909]|uniref:hypothetical protein n=1 Tax=Streptomyces sp. NPDC059909 TaxID=3346998 RepID=UPI00366184BD
MAKKGRVFVRRLTSETYLLGEFRRQQLAHERVRDDSVVVDDANVAHSGDSEKSRTWWRIGPGDEDFLTQTIQVHFVGLPGQSSNHGHGHQNDDKAVALVVKAKCTWMFMGPIQQGRSGPVENEERFGPREEWGRIRTRVLDRKKVISPSDTVWEDTPLGRVRVLASPEKTDGRIPQNHVCQLFAADGTPLRLFNAQNRVFKHLGYNNVHYFEAAPEYAGDRALADATA